MHNIRRFLVATVVPALIVSIFAVGAAAAHGPSGKVELCHWASHKFVKITVSRNAESSHLRHGDVEMDEYGDCSSDNDEDNDDGNGADSDDVDGNESDQGSQHNSGNHGSGHDSNKGEDVEDD